MPAILMTIIGGAVGAIASFVARVLTVETLKFLAWRAFYLFIVFVCLPLVLYNVSVDLIFDLLNSAMQYAGNFGYDSVTVQLTGMAGYIANQIHLPEAFSIYITAISVRFAMSFIPFLK